MFVSLQHRFKKKVLPGHCSSFCFQFSVFGEWEKAGVSGGNPRKHRKIMQTPCRKAPAWNQTRDPLAVRQQC